MHCVLCATAFTLQIPFFQQDGVAQAASPSHFSCAWSASLICAGQHHSCVHCSLSACWAVSSGAPTSCRVTMCSALTAQPQPACWAPLCCQHLAQQLRRHWRGTTCAHSLQRWASCQADSCFVEYGSVANGRILITPCGTHHMHVQASHRGVATCLQHCNGSRHKTCCQQTRHLFPADVLRPCLAVGCSV